MADEIRKVITVDVSGAVESMEELDDATTSTGYSFKSLGDAKKYIDKLKASLIDLDEESEEYAETVAEIADVQEKMDKAMKATGSTIKGAAGSYNELSKRMSELKKEFKATNDEMERNILAKQIVSINNQLKTMDASIGNYQRNVGNYEAAFTKGLSNISDKISSLGNPLAIAKNGVNTLGKAFKSLISNPIGAAIMAIVVAVKALKVGFENSEEASNKLKRAFSAFEPIINMVKNAFTGFANIVGTVAEKAIPALVNGLQKAGEWMMKLLNKIGIVSDEKLKAFQDSIEKQKESIRLSQELTEREIALEERKRKMMVENAKSEMVIADLRAKAADKEKYTAEERKKYLEKAIATEKALNAAKLSIAQEEYNIALERSKQTDNTAADNERLAQLQANLYNVKKDYFEKERSLNNELKSINGELVKSAEEANKAQAKLDEEAKKQREKDLEEIKKIKERASQALLTSVERDKEILKKKYEEELALLKKYEEDTTALTDEYNRKRAEIDAEAGEKKIKNLDEEATLQQFIAEKTIQNEYEKSQRLLEIDRERLEQEKEIYQELWMLDDISGEKKEEYARRLEEINAAIIDNDRQKTEVQKKQAIDLVDTYSDVAKSIGQLMDTIADIWQESIKQRKKNGKITEEQAKKEFEQVKKAQIAGAIVNGLAGIAAAVANAMQLPFPVNAIMAAVNSTLVATTTALQVAKIKNTTYDGGGSSVSAEVSPSTPTETATAYTPQYSTNVTGESETTNLANAITDTQSEQRVYVVESDINEVGRRVEVRESESTF